jgi:hypothetical protein
VIDDRSKAQEIYDRVQRMAAHVGDIAGSQAATRERALHWLWISSLVTGFSLAVSIFALLRAFRVL